MKKRCGILLSIWIVFVTLSACSFGNGDKEEEMKDSPSFSTVEEMEEITVEGNTVTVALLQDIPLPYRWGITYQSDCATLVEEYEVEDPWEDSVFSTGSAEEYHVFVFELTQADTAQLKFHNKWVIEPENLTEANGIRNFILEFTDGQWKVISAESTD